MRVVVWKSSDNKREIHIYSGDTEDTYIAGFNPELIADDEMYYLLEDTVLSGKDQDECDQVLDQLSRAYLESKSE